MKVVKCIFLFTLCFFYIFGPVFRPIGAWMDFIFVTSTILSLYGFFIAKFKIPKYFRLFFILIFVFTYVLVSISIYPFTTQEDYIRVILIPIRILVTMYGGFVLVYLLNDKYKNEYFDVLLKFIFCSILIHGLIMAYQFYDPNFKDLIYFYTSTGDFRSSNEYNFRMGGLTGNPGDSILSVVQSLGIIMIPWMFKRASLFGKLFLFIGGVFVFYSILICGRSGIWATIIMLPISVYLASDKKGAALLVMLFSRTFIFIALFALVLFLFDHTEAESPLYYALKRSLDTFLDYKESGNFEDHTVQAITTFVLFPTDIKILFFGNGEHMVNTQFSRTLDSDIGYIRNMWAMGIIVASLYWAPIFYYTIVAAKLVRKYKPAALLLCCSLIMLVFHAKESYLYVRMFLSIYSLMLFSLYISVRNKNLQ